MTATPDVQAQGSAAPNPELYLQNIVTFLNDMALDESYDSQTRTRALTAGEKCNLILAGLRRAKVAALRRTLAPPAKDKPEK